MNHHPIKVNADYESALFGGAESLEINQALEFLALFLEQRPLHSLKNYSQEYLLYVEAVAGWKPIITKDPPAEMWWGRLENPQLERTLNSKITSTNLVITQGWCQHTAIINSAAEFKLSDRIPLLIKDPHSMSGRGFMALKPAEEVPKHLREKLQSRCYIVEPLEDRRYDFSHYYFPDGTNICYENLVDQRFQYKGSVFQNWRQATIDTLSFYHLPASSHWSEFSSALKTIEFTYREMANSLQQSIGFSVDSFIYQQDSQLKIRYLSEVNFRRTMGMVTYQLAQKYASSYPWASLRIEKSYKSSGGFLEIKKRLNELLLSQSKDSGLIILSPGDSRFEMYFLCAINQVAGEQLKQRMDQLLSNS